MDKEKIPNILRASEALGINYEEFIFNIDKRLGESEEFKQTISLLETINNISDEKLEELVTHIINNQKGENVND